jgi:DNA-binding SARP family transcriptional activator
LVTLRWLGGFALDGPSGAAAPALPKRRAEAVLAVLAVCGDLGCSRERLLALLWPESDEATARHGVRDALHIIRRALGPGAVPSAGRLLRLDPAVVASDVLSFTQALATDRAADAVRLYGGPLLDGFHVDDAVEFERWLDGERARLAREYGETLKRLAGAAERAGAWDEAAGWWARAVEHDPVNSHLVLQQVRVLAGTGDRANAIRVAEGHARRLREEFDLEPDREILTMVEGIRRGELPPMPEVDVTLSQAKGAIPAPGPLRPAEGSDAAPAARPVLRWVPWAAGVAALALIGAFAVARRPGARTLDDAFAVQSDIAQRVVASAWRWRGSDAERRRCRRSAGWSGTTPSIRIGTSRGRSTAARGSSRGWAMRRRRSP